MRKHRHTTYAATLFSLVLMAGWLVATIPAAASTTAKATRQNGPNTVQTVNINHAGLQQLVTLPGIGPHLADRIIRYREKNGAFKRIEELMNVRGIGPKLFKRIRSNLSV